MKMNISCSRCGPGTVVNVLSMFVHDIKFSFSSLYHSVVLCKGRRQYPTQGIKEIANFC